ncbi:hypothetical protein SAMN04489810_1121 [Microbacterium pygmaeum]|uniref:Uncharacterized protein n=1 Tax=Microbacterium pygmaeum TaxID=370764 RepID=A0A1G7WL61_9MICO|nr:hypothetical protein SAMN04489810_1121 [Microbacterium pygmaeum]
MPRCQPVAAASDHRQCGAMDTDKQNTQGTPGEDEEADTASGGAPEAPDTTDENDRPLDNPSGG